MVQVAVGDVRLVGRGVDEDLGDAAEVLQVVAVGLPGRLAVVPRRPPRPGLAELHEELAVLGELQNLRVVTAVAADPDVPLVVDRDAVVRLGPLVALAGAAPGVQQVAGLIELEDRRRRNAALLRRLRIGRRAHLRPLVQGHAAAVDDPDVILRIDRHADRRAEQPVVRQRLRPHRIDLKPRGHRGLLGLGLCPPYQQGARGTERDEKDQEDHADQQLSDSHRDLSRRPWVRESRQRAPGCGIRPRPLGADTRLTGGSILPRCRRGKHPR